jgi:hypothetical protein
MPLGVVRYRESRAGGGEDRTVVSTPFETVAEARAEAARKTEAFVRRGYNAEQDHWWCRADDILYFSPWRERSGSILGIAEIS